MNKQERAFVESVYDHYRRHGRHDLPWRKTKDPYCITVSEIMLQQTQVDRVILKYRAFLTTFPTVHAVAGAPLGDVLRSWSGLGYNRRAKFLHQLAQTIVHEYDGKFPTEAALLKTLPGIGPYTATAIAAFAYNTPAALIETNIRTVYLHHFFKNKSAVSDAELLPVIKKTLDEENPRAWYWALMDYGSFLKKEGNVIHRQGRAYAKQSAFKGSRRELRGAVMRLLLNGPMPLARMVKTIERKKDAVESVLADLLKEGFVKKEKGNYAIK